MRQLKLGVKAPPHHHHHRNWLPTPKGDFYLIFRNYAPEASVSEALKDRATFDGPPGVMPVQ